MRLRGGECLLQYSAIYIAEIGALQIGAVRQHRDGQLDDCIAAVFFGEYRLIVQISRKLHELSSEHFYVRLKQLAQHHAFARSSNSIEIFRYAAEEIGRAHV